MKWKDFQVKIDFKYINWVLFSIWEKKALLWLEHKKIRALTCNRLRDMRWLEQTVFETLSKCRQV